MDNLRTRFAAGIRVAFSLVLVPGCVLAGASTDTWQRHYDAGKSAYEAGNYARAQSDFTAAVAEAESSGDQMRLARSLNNLAAAYAAQKRYAEAEPLYQRALALLEQVRGSDHLDVAICLENYAQLLRQTNRVGEAERLEGRVQQIRQQPR